MILSNQKAFNILIEWQEIFLLALYSRHLDPASFQTQLDKCS